MWKSISQVLADQLGAYYSIKEKIQVAGGELNEAWIINDGIQPIFVKINERSYRSMFRAEADQLQLLAKTKTIRVPQVYGVGCSQSHSFLLLEALPMDTISNANIFDFGVQLARLHQWQGLDKYGLDFDTWLGSVHQPNSWKTNWATFFSEQRIGWQLQLCKEKNIHFGNIRQITNAIEQQLTKHNPTPALLHGDLWYSNCASVNGQAVVYDPACYWGDRECDLALIELSIPSADEFFEGYESVYPLHYEGFLLRKPLYKLYYLLNFSHRFQGQYIEQAQKIIELFT